MIMVEWSDEGRKFEYKHETYWPALVEMCDKRRKQELERWRELGGTVGLKEWDVKGGQSTMENGKTEVTVGGEKETASS
jgi:hypothetical protein